MASLPNEEDDQLDRDLSFLSLQALINVESEYPDTVVGDALDQDIDDEPNSLYSEMILSNLACYGTIQDIIDFDFTFGGEKEVKKFVRQDDDSITFYVVEKCPAGAPGPESECHECLDGWHALFYRSISKNPEV